VAAGCKQYVRELKQKGGIVKGMKFSCQKMKQLVKKNERTETDKESLKAAGKLILTHPKRLLHFLKGKRPVRAASNKEEQIKIMCTLEKSLREHLNKPESRIYAQQALILWFLFQSYKLGVEDVVRGLLRILEVEDVEDNLAEVILEIVWEVVQEGHDVEDKQASAFLVYINDGFMTIDVDTLISNLKSLLKEERTVGKLIEFISFVKTLT